ncbi:MAG: hypothetical protein ACYC57_03940 [Thermoleophilia bacterium]
MIFPAVALMIIAIILAGCGGSSGITSDDHGRIAVGMTMDEVEEILGQPERSHVTGASQDPAIFWYYSKSEGDGLFKVAFEQGRVTSVAPYDQSFEVGE